MTITESFRKLVNDIFQDPLPKTHKIPFRFQTATRRRMTGYMIVEFDARNFYEYQEQLLEFDRWAIMQLLYYLNEHRETLKLCRRRHGFEGFEAMVCHFLAGEFIKSGCSLRELHLEELTFEPRH